MIGASSLFQTPNIGAAVPAQRCGICTLVGRRFSFHLCFQSAAGQRGRLMGFMAGCFKVPLQKGLRKKIEEESVQGGVDVWDATTSGENYPEHLVIMVNGIIGSAADWRYAAEQFVKKLPDKVIVHRSECNSSRLTFDGVDLMGERLAEEVLSVVRRRPGVQKISFVAHSLGGLVARYAIGKLYAPIPDMEALVMSQNHLSEGSASCSTQSQCLEKDQDGKVAGLDPMNFITFATPHLGSRGHKQLPFLCGLPFLERRASETAHWIVGRTGKHLFLTDDDGGKPPLLLQMVDDFHDLKFISALRSFKRRVAYANANFDYVVGWRTSSIRRQHELPKYYLLMKDEKYPHIVYIEKPDPDTIHQIASSNVVGKAVDLEGSF